MVPVLIEKSPNTKIIQVKAGATHVLALDTRGNIYSWGTSGFGALGMKQNTFSSIPSRVKLHSNINDIEKIDCGPDCSLVLLKNGEVFACGRNNYNKLGLGRKNENVMTFVSNYLINSLFNCISLFLLSSRKKWMFSTKKW